MQSSKNRMIFGVIAADVSFTAQRELIIGIIDEAKKYNIDIAVISNIYNENCCDRELAFENVIYDLILLSEFDGFIMLSESFPCEKLQKKIHKHLLARNDVPIIIAGSMLPDFELPDLIHINTDNEKDMEETVNHMIEEHGFTDIDFLTGYDCIEVSHMRVEGYKNALKKHNIPFDESKVIYGDFWLESGKKLAEEYIEGRRPYPQAVVCANDYMAFGLQDEFARRNINIFNNLSVAGFDFSMMRTSHSPLLTSYRFNRKQLGRDAVKILYKKIKFNINEEFLSPKGNIIHGISCRCSFLKTELNEELEFIRSNQLYEQWSLNSNMEEKITSCRTLDEFMEIAGEYQYLVRYVQDIFICLYENWYEYKPDTQIDNLTCRSIMPWFDNSSFSLTQNKLTDILLRSDKSAAYFFSPLVFDNRLFGYAILKYDNPDSYDIIFKHWIKSVSNGLEFLRLKHDIRYLMKCQTLGKTQDSLTALRNDAGMKIAFDNSKDIKDKGTLFIIMLKVCLFHDDFNDIDKTNKIASLLDITDALKQLGIIHNVICGRINDTTFLCLLNSKNYSAEQVEDHLKTFLTQHRTYLSFYGMDSFLHCILPFSEKDVYTDLKEKCIQNINIQLRNKIEKHNINYYEKMLEIRNSIYLNPQEDISTDDVCRKYSFSPGYLRVMYKKCFGISFLQDYINSRISKAKYLLLTTDLKINTIAADCGYNDTKYFLRQFLNCTGESPNKYRLIHSES